MSIQRKIFYLFIALAAIILLPYIGAWIHLAGVFPTDFFMFPPLTTTPKAGFDLYIFIALALMFLIIALFYIFPTWFGFHAVPTAPAPPPPSVPFPLWFWGGLLSFLATGIVLWGHFSQPRWLIDWSVIPLFWGFTMILDGIVYKRTGGRSLVKMHPQRIIAVGVASIGGWLLFEYLNFFINDSWVYPFGDYIPQDEFMTYAVLGSSGLMAMSFEWYSLLFTFPRFTNRYTNGWHITFPNWLKTLLMLTCFVLLFFMNFYPNYLGALIWLVPLFVLSIVLSKLQIWSPWTSMKTGNWAPIMIVALTYLIQGTLCECWNYFSASHAGGVLTSYNPDYWTYSIAYVNVLHVFEMPLLGLMGYLPFGVYCGVWWIVFSFLLNIQTDYGNGNHETI